MPEKRKTTRTGKGLVAIVGGAVAAALFAFVPAEESGRKVEATVSEDGKAVDVRHVAGRQYLKVYLDIVGVPTACDGITRYKGKKLPINHTFSESQCEHMLAEELEKHAAGMMKCTPGLALDKHPGLEKAKEGPRTAAASLTFNVGIGGYCSSTAAKRFNAYDFAGGCEAMTWWNKAGGRTVQGLVNRREREYEICMGGL